MTGPTTAEFLAAAQRVRLRIRNAERRPPSVPDLSRATRLAEVEWSAAEPLVRLHLSRTFGVHIADMLECAASDTDPKMRSHDIMNALEAFAATLANNVSVAVLQLTQRGDADEVS